MSPRITVSHNGADYAGQLMTIKSTRLGWEDHGILTASLVCEYPGGGVSVGGHCLDECKRDADGRPVYPSDRLGTAYGLDHVMQIMLTVGVERWEKLPGSLVIVLSTGTGGLGSMSVGIAGVQNDRVLILKDHAEAWHEVADGGAR
ncbi:hypothetical protein GCM10027047_01270 [Rhodococcus aerolatus]